MIDYPKTRHENTLFRANLLSEADKDKQTQSAIYDICRSGNDGLLFWINNFCWIYEPRPEQYNQLGYDQPHLLFLTWDFQDDTILWIKDRIESGEDGEGDEASI